VNIRRHPKTGSYSACWQGTETQHLGTLQCSSSLPRRIAWKSTSVYQTACFRRDQHCLLLLLTRLQTTLAHMDNLVDWLKPPVNHIESWQALLISRQPRDVTLLIICISFDRPEGLGIRRPSHPCSWTPQPGFIPRLTQLHACQSYPCAVCQQSMSRCACCCAGAKTISSCSSNC